jgi:hypothetical protein
LIDTMLDRCDRTQAWRFLDLAPSVGIDTQKLADCKDFCDFIDYFILRRDQQQCGADELGALAMLSVAFQRQIEHAIEARANGRIEGRDHAGTATDTSSNDVFGTG